MGLAMLSTLTLNYLFSLPCLTSLTIPTTLKVLESSPNDLCDLPTYNCNLIATMIAIKLLFDCYYSKW